MNEAVQKSYVVNGGPKGLPLLGSLPAIHGNALRFLMDNSLRYGDIIPFRAAGRQMYQANHPDLVRHVLMDNYRNYKKSQSFRRFESTLGHGILSSYGDKWKRDRQKIQPMFKRDLIEGYYFDIVNAVGEKCKSRWLKLTENGPAEINISQEMASIALEVIVKLVFGKDNLDEETTAGLYRSSVVLIEYLKGMRLLPGVDLRGVFRTPASLEFKKALKHVDDTLDYFAQQYKSGATASDKSNMLAMLIEAQRQDPEHFTDLDIRDNSVTMVFAGFETTAILMQWMWYALDLRPEIADKLRAHIVEHAPSTAKAEDANLDFKTVDSMDYLTMVFKETLRLYPSFWATSREAIADDSFGGVTIRRGESVVLPHIVLQRHPRWWEQPNAFIPERFTPEKEAAMDEGFYFPFSLGPRKCSGYRLAEMETKTVFAKLLPLFKATVVNGLNNGVTSSVSLRPKELLRVKIERI